MLTAVLCQAQDDVSGYLFSPGKQGTLGVGYGFPYGGYGFSADLYFLDNLALSVGVGTFLYSAGYELGVKYLHGTSQKTWRPQAMILYGINGIIIADSTYIGNIREAYPGFTIGVGSQFMFGQKKKHGLDVGVTYVLSSGLYKRLKELEDMQIFLESSSRFGFYLGYRYAFEFKY
jgi:hypothetical protein